LKTVEGARVTMNDDYELFVFDGKVGGPTWLMKSIDKKLPPASILERGAEAVRAYWNNKNLRKRKGVIE